MANLTVLKAQIENVNAIGIANLAEKGIDLSENATTYEIMQEIANVSGGRNEYQYGTVRNPINEKITLNITINAEVTV